MGKEDNIKTLLEKDISYSAIGRILGVNRLTVKNFVKSRNLQWSCYEEGIVLLDKLDQTRTK